MLCIQLGLPILFPRSYPLPLISVAMARGWTSLLVPAYIEPPHALSRLSTLILRWNFPCFFSCGTAEPCSDLVEVVAIGSSAVASSGPSRSSIKSACWFLLMPFISQTRPNGR